MIILYLIIVVLLISIIVRKPKFNLRRMAKIAITLAIGALLVRFGASYAAPFTTLLGFLVAYNQPIKKLLEKFWQQHAQNSATSRNSTMSIQEAREILGVSDNPTKAEIKEAYHRLMRKIHPDHGGSEYISKKINEAKEILMNRH